MAAHIRTDTKVLYGVLVSEKSFLIGGRTLVKKYHAGMLAMRVTGDKLPMELKDLVSDALYALETQTVKSMWRSDMSYDRNEKKFAYFALVTPAEIAAVEHVRSLGVSPINVHISRPKESLGEQVRSEASYVHLSSIRHRPSLCLNVPSGGPIPPHNGGFSYPSLTHGKLRTGCDAAPERGPKTLRDVGGIWCDYHPAGDDRKEEKEEVSGTVTTLALCTGVEDAIRDWDADAVKAYVELLGLRVVPVDDGDPLKPRLQVWQRVLDY